MTPEEQSQYLLDELLNGAGQITGRPDTPPSPSPMSYDDTHGGLIPSATGGSRPGQAAGVSVLDEDYPSYGQTPGARELADAQGERRTAASLERGDAYTRRLANQRRASGQLYDVGATSRPESVLERLGGPNIDPADMRRVVGPSPLDLL